MYIYITCRHISARPNSISLILPWRREVFLLGSAESVVPLRVLISRPQNLEIHLDYGLFRETLRCTLEIEKLDRIKLKNFIIF